MRGIAFISMIGFFGLSTGGFAAEVDEARIQKIAVGADAIEQVMPEFAADCRFAYTLLGNLVSEKNVFKYKRSGSDIDEAGAMLRADVWGLVLLREARKSDIDPMELKTRFMRDLENSSHLGRSTHVSRASRHVGGMTGMVEKKIRKCEKVAQVSEASK